MRRSAGVCVVYVIYGVRAVYIALVNSVLSGGVCNVFYMFNERVRACLYVDDDCSVCGRCKVYNACNICSLCVACGIYSVRNVCSLRREVAYVNYVECVCVCAMRVLPTTCNACNICSARSVYDVRRVRKVCDVLNVRNMYGVRDMCCT